MTDITPLSNMGALIFVALSTALAVGLWRGVWWLLTSGGALFRRLGPRLNDTYAVRRTRPVRNWLKGSFPRGYAGIADRFDPSRPVGLPLTLVAVAAVYMVVLLFGLVETVMESEEIDAFDDFVFGIVAPLRNAVLVRGFGWITQFGSTATLLAVAIVATGFLWARGPKWGVPTVWLTVLGAQATTWTGKFLIDRPRPDFILDVTAWSPSFPSGHATGATAVYGIIAYAIARDLPDYRRRYDVIYATFVLVATIAFSRIYLSVHYPTDIAAGLLVGGFWVLVGVALAEWLRHSYH